MQISLQGKRNLRARSLIVQPTNFTQILMARRYAFIPVLVYKLCLNYRTRMQSLRSFKRAGVHTVPAPCNCANIHCRKHNTAADYKWNAFGVS